MLTSHAPVTVTLIPRIVAISKLTTFVLSLSTTTARSKSPFSVPGLIDFNRRRRSYHRGITSMAGAGSVPVDIAGESNPEHVTGNWFSVPELRLRDHRFIVPLDYSKTSPKITVFAREIVAGNLDHDTNLKLNLF